MKDSMVEKALRKDRENYVNRNIKMGYLVALETGFRRGFAYGRSSRDILRKALEEAIELMVGIPGLGLDRERLREVLAKDAGE